MADVYTIDPTLGRLSVQAFATGLLSALGHSPTFAARDYSGTIRFEGGEVRRMSLELKVVADSLDLEDRVSAADRAEIERRTRAEVIETASYSEIKYRSSNVAVETIDRGRYRLGIGGQLSLHGQTRPQQVDAELTVLEDGVRLRGGCSLRLSDFRIKPVTALAGAIKLKDDVSLSFDIAATPEGP